MGVYVTVLIIELLPILYIIKVFKGTKNSFEKGIYFLVLFAFLFPGFVYLVDDFNIPSNLGWTNNLGKHDWFSFLTNYFSTIFGFCISFFFTLFITKKQISEANAKSREERRINNMPLLQYSFPVIENNNRLIDTYNVLETKFNDNKTIVEEINLEIKNVGMNAVKKCYVKINGDVLVDSFLFEVINQEQGSSIICKDKSNIISLILNLNPEDTYNFKFIVYYQDLISNWYEQDLSLEYNLTNTFNNNHRIVIKHFKVSDEVLLNNNREQLPVDLKDIIKNK